MTLVADLEVHLNGCSFSFHGAINVRSLCSRSACLQCFDRKRQKEFIAFLEYLDAEIPETIKKIHLVCDNVSTHHGKQVRKWLENHPRFVFHFTPVHCSWMNQVEQWFSILQRKRFRISDFESKADLEGKIKQFVDEWN